MNIPPTIQDYRELTPHPNRIGQARGYASSSQLLRDASQPLVTIITTVRNGAATLQEAMDSVFAQTYPNIEYIVIDGVSTDGTIEIIRKNADRLALWFSEPDKGIYDAWNKGIALANGDFVLTFNSDDVLYPDAIAKYVSFAKQNPDVLAFQANLNYDVAGQRIIPIKPKIDLREEDFCMMPVHDPTLFVSLSCYRQHGLYDLRYPIAADHEYALRLVRAGLNIKHMNEIVIRMRSGGVSYSSMKGWDDIGRVLRDKRVKPSIIFNWRLWYAKFWLLQFLENSPMLVPLLNAYRKMKYDVFKTKGISY